MMHLPLSAPSALLAGAILCLATVARAAGVVEIDIVFPRNNQTYAPTSHFPIVFALQNLDLATHLDPYLQYFIRNGSDLEESYGHSNKRLTPANASADPLFIYRYVTMDTEGRHELFASAYWNSCDETGDEIGILGNSTNLWMNFTIAEDGQTVDLVAATADDKTCAAKDGVAINVTDQTREVQVSGETESATCAVLASASPTATANPCKIKIDEAAAESMLASLHDGLCKGTNPPDDCPEEDAAWSLKAAGVASLAATLGVILFLGA